jgi:hypothetical protein
MYLNKDIVVSMIDYLYLSITYPLFQSYTQKSNKELTRDQGNPSSSYQKKKRNLTHINHLINYTPLQLLEVLATSLQGILTDTSIKIRTSRKREN